MRIRGDDLQKGSRSPPARGGHAMRNALLLSVFVALWLVDLYFDVRHRDGFTWMDPEQYFAFAKGLAEGAANLKGFGVPTLFPFFIVPFLSAGGGIPMAFCVNAAAMVALVVALALLRHEAGLSTPTVVIVALALSSPLLTGLSRELYVEFFLTALAALNLWLALKLVRRFTWLRAAAFAAIFMVGFLTKMTFPVFAAVPLGGAVIGSFLCGRRGQSLLLLSCGVVPFAIAITIGWFLFPGAAEYYRTIGNTTIPVMQLIGPGKLEPVGAYFYYLVEVFRNQLWLLSPLVLLAVAVFLRRARGWRWEMFNGPKAALWFAFLLPLIILGFSAVREPRHVAPVTVPAVLLIVMAIEAIPAAKIRRMVLAVAVGLAAVQYAAVTVWHRPTPYFVDGPFHHQEILSALPPQPDVALSAGLPPPMRVLQWKFNRNIVIAGFPPNEALALNWEIFPGIVYDLATVRDVPPPDAIPYRSFEDLFLLTAFNTYNRRCGVGQDAYASLSRDEVLTNAEFIIARIGDPANALPAFAGHTLVRSLDFPGERILIFQSDAPAVMAYRRLYAEHYLALHPRPAPAEASAIAFNLMAVDVLRGDDRAVDELLRRFPAIRERPRNIYWVGGYEPILAQAQALFQQHLRHRAR